MSSVHTRPRAFETVADLLGHLGDIAPSRVRLQPAPGTATEQDVLDVHAREGRLCELVDNVLVEKAVGLREAFLASVLTTMLWGFVRARNLGLVTGEAGMMRLAPGLVRMPDVAFISWDRLPERRVPNEPIPDLVPDLVVEILSAGNTAGEMARKCHEYLAAGVRQVWLIDPEARAVAVHTAPNEVAFLYQDQTLEGGEVLPGFTVSLRELFAALDLQGQG
jgi:Uma2 family endonuclease